MAELDPKSCVVLETLGEGGEGVVRRGTYGGKDVALKFSTSEGEEVEVLKGLQHVNVLRLVGWFEANRCETCVVTELCDACVFDVYEKSAIHVDDTRLLARQLLCGLAFIHSRNMLHNDIKPENLLLQGACLKIADFSLATHLTDEDPIQTKGTINYMSPERIHHNPVTFASDMWSFGCTLHFLLHRALLFDAPSEFLAMTAVVAYTEPSPSSIPVEGCLAGRPSSRPSATSCLQHSWLTAVNPDAPFKSISHKAL